MIGRITSPPVEPVEPGAGAVGVGDAVGGALSVGDVLGWADGGALDWPAGVAVGVAGTAIVNVHWVRSTWPSSAMAVDRTVNVPAT